jgi:hypothetical protein
MPRFYVCQLDTLFVVRDRDDERDTFADDAERSIRLTAYSTRARAEEAAERWNSAWEEALGG